jgi:ABC-type antimicrobial peptide transport system permease subunit
MVLREVGVIAGVGIQAGLPVAAAAGTLIERLLFGVKAGDTVSLCATILLLLAVAFLAAWIPARRASSVDPMTALRWE